MLDGRKISQYFPAVYYLFGDNMTVDDFATVTQRIIRGCIEPHEEKVFKVYQAEPLTSADAEPARMISTLGVKPNED